MPYSKEEMDLLREHADLLSPRELEILLLRSGIKDGKPMGLKDVGDRLGITRERARQIERKAFSKMKTAEAPSQKAPK